MRYLAAILALLFVLSVDGEGAAQVPQRAGQPHADLFEVAGYGSLQPLNPMTQKVRNQRAAAYRLLTMPGCFAGTIPGDLERMNAEAANKIGLNLFRNDSAYDFTVRINCGSEQVRVCGAVTIFCLGRGFPYNVDVELSDILSGYQVETRLSIPLHEIVGHALATWHEQYCLGTETSGVCRGLAQFTPAPNWVDVMNTGPNSRHGLETIEVERWERTMYLLQVPEPEWGPCTSYDNGLSVACYNRPGAYWSWTKQATFYWRPETGWFCADGCP